jgi:hypothetical protein
VLDFDKRCRIQGVKEQKSKVMQETKGVFEAGKKLVVNGKPRLTRAGGGRG